MADEETTENILRITNEKYAMGKITRNEILQLELELVNSKKAIVKARDGYVLALRDSWRLPSSSCDGSPSTITKKRKITYK